MSVCSSNLHWLLIGQLQWHQDSSLVTDGRASHLHISLPLPIMSWWYAGRISGGSLSSNERVEWWPVGQSEARWHWWVRGWPVVTSVVTVIRVWSPNMGHLRAFTANECGMSHSHWYGQSWLLQKSPDKYSLLLSPRHSLHFSSSQRLFRLTLY